MTLLRPTAIAIHNHGHMARQTLQIELFEELSFLGRQWAESSGDGNLKSRM